MRAWSQNAPLLKKFLQKERALLIVMGRSVDEVSLDVDIDRVWVGSCHNATATPNRKNQYFKRDYRFFIIQYFYLVLPVFNLASNFNLHLFGIVGYHEVD